VTASPPRAGALPHRVLNSECVSSIVGCGAKPAFAVVRGPNHAAQGRALIYLNTRGRKRLSAPPSPLSRIARHALVDHGRWEVRPHL